MKRGVISFLTHVTILSLGPFACASALELKSADIQVGQPIGQKFVYDSLGCNGQNISPELIWSDPPEGTKSFAVVVHDPDAPTGGAGFFHWIVADIPASVRSLPQGAGAADGKKLAAGSRQLENDFGDPGWGGPCPPPRASAHRYNFTIYALGIERLGLPANAKASVAQSAIEKNALAKATISSRYGR
jgi:Raf kinase inhibitor-like YbhB/YbcL family protein